MIESVEESSGASACDREDGRIIKGASVCDREGGGIIRGCLCVIGRVEKYQRASVIERVKESSGASVMGRVEESSGGCLRVISRVKESSGGVCDREGGGIVWRRL